jgi:hypothetical protein
VEVGCSSSKQESVVMMVFVLEERDLSNGVQQTLDVAAIQQGCVNVLCVLFPGC